jgi:nifR3 family TIM-barrel protein
LDIFDFERPIGIQIFGSDIDSMRESAIISSSVNPDLIDINYGCPVKNVACKGAGAALLRDIPKMVQMTSEIVKSTHLPVTVKTRLGWDESTKNVEEVAERLQDIGIKALTVHGRTRVQMYKGDADWTLIRKIKENPRIQIPIFGNGDVDSPEKALKMKNDYGVDGIMIGRASIGNPWIFNQIKYLVVQAGTALNEKSNTGVFDEKTLKYLYSVLVSKDFSDDDLSKIQKQSDFSQISVGTDKQFYEEILKGIGAPITDENLKFFLYFL